MKPYYEADGITIYHGDCRDVLPALTADAVVMDPPYGVGVGYDGFDDTQDATSALMAEVLPLAMAAAPVVVTFTGTKNIFRYPEPTWVLCWHCPSGYGAGPWGFTCWQPIFAYGGDPYLKAGMGSRPDSISTPFGSTKMAEQEGATGHPCPKPLKLMRWLVLRSSLDGSTVVDPFMGSGSTLRAAKDLGRKAIGIEQSERYCEIAVKRLAQGVLDLGGAA